MNGIQVTSPKNSAKRQKHAVTINEMNMPYICLFCQKSFAYLTHYKEHIRFHTDESHVYVKSVMNHFYT